MRVAINGMGRIGRLLFRRLLRQPGVEVVAVNDIMDRENLFYLLKYDSIYGTISVPITMGHEAIRIDEKEIPVLQQADASLLPWSILKVDVVIECTGKYNTTEGCSQHLQAGAKKVLLSTTGDAAMPLFIYGYNQHSLSDNCTVFSPGGCMTNCSVPVLDILETQVGIESVHFNFLHSYTSRQELIDAPNKVFRRGRAAAEAIIPVEIDQRQTLERLLPSLKGKIAATSTRVPVANGAMADTSLVLKANKSALEINAIFREAASGPYKNILEYTEEQVVSVDIKGNSHSCIIDGSLTASINNHVKLMIWFDNEYGFTSRVIDWLLYWNK
jgi:glyceraldehyde 3-phosphate dehydrogenase